MNFLLRSTLSIFILSLTFLAGTTKTVTVKDDDVSGNTQWTSDNTYLLDGYVFVEAGDTLGIEAGTLIQGKSSPTTGDKTSALIVARGGQIFARGTEKNPIIFTFEGDDGSKYLPDSRGLWGGVLILGSTETNYANDTSQVEGIPTTEPRGSYGGKDNNDNSGVFKYVSIRYGGHSIGAGNEINGLTLAAVGSQTEVHHVEVFNNLDDGIEWFSGTVNTHHLVTAFCGDDSYDYDEGFRGQGQFWFTIQDTAIGNRCGEHDGGPSSCETCKPYSQPQIYNVTYMGSGKNTNNADNDFILKIRDNSGGIYYNSIFMGYGGQGIEVEDLGSGEDSRKRLDSNQLEIGHNIWYDLGAGNSLSDIAPQDFVEDTLSANNNTITDPQLQSIARSNNGNLDPRPKQGSPALSTSKPPPNNNFFAQVDYKGAFSKDSNWLKNWTALDKLNIVGGNKTAIASEKSFKGQLLQNSPNPFSNQTTIRYNLKQEATINLSLYSIRGEKVKNLQKTQNKASGNYEVKINGNDLQPGVYFYKLNINNKTSKTRKLIVTQ